MNLHYDRTPSKTIDEVIPLYGRKEFQSSTRSTLPLLSLLKHEQPLVSSLLQDIGMAADCNLHLEYRVKPPTGSGKASRTDLMVVSGGSALAVEAKWTEPQYDTVGEWLSKGPDPLNRQQVLTSWLDLLQRHASRTLHVGDFSGAIYQMVHRAASACEAGHNPKMAYLVFKPSPGPRTADMHTIYQHLLHLWTLLDSPEEFRFYMIGVCLSPTGAFDAIASLPKADAVTAQLVGAALLSQNRLFRFRKYCITTVGEKA